MSNDVEEEEDRTKADPNVADWIVREVRILRAARLVVAAVMTVVVCSLYMCSTSTFKGLASHIVLEL